MLPEFIVPDLVVNHIRLLPSLPGKEIFAKLSVSGKSDKYLYNVVTFDKVQILQADLKLHERIQERLAKPLMISPGYDWSRGLQLSYLWARRFFWMSSGIKSVPIWDVNEGQELVFRGNSCQVESKPSPFWCNDTYKSSIFRNRICPASEFSLSNYDSLWEYLLAKRHDLEKVVATELISQKSNIKIGDTVRVLKNAVGAMKMNNFHSLKPGDKVVVANVCEHRYLGLPNMPNLPSITYWRKLEGPPRVEVMNYLPTSDVELVETGPAYWLVKGINSYDMSIYRNGEFFSTYSCRNYRSQLKEHTKEGDILEWWNYREDSKSSDDIPSLIYRYVDDKRCILVNNAGRLAHSQVRTVSTNLFTPAGRPLDEQEYQLRQKYLTQIEMS